ncbi:TonB-dependent receptor [Sphingomonas sp. LY29]|uniref:TonB-dependent receptor plug domain-containing protein n=1 Tax=Sphingomonas sp. LY29 TaxID=3095341 RepID=UPI002D780D70|nr:TonB-dependent receptor [Sphingomonas sp. LY29]WRP24702.1 TonB-dependent receptor [Sphingomonas sp. LY29]
MKLDFRQRLLATTLLVGASMVANPAFAQEVPPADQNPPETTAPLEGTTPPSTSATGEEIQEAQDVVVTGSRIPQPNLTSASPVTVISAQEVKLQGTTRTEDLINSLPQSFAAQGSNVSNGSTGTATVNLRGLGSARTLVLINGRRLMPGDPRSPVADINFVPSSLIKRVDVLTGGASSVYGADAVAGVVNFIMDTTFTGLRIDGQASVFNHNNRLSNDVADAIDARGFPRPGGMVTDGGAQDISVAFGTGFADNRGHIMAYATYRKQDAITQDRRDYSACSLTGLNAAQIATTGRRYSCGGSGTSANGTFFTNVGTFQVGTGRNFIPGSTPFNFAPYNYYQRPNERYTAGAFAEFEISDYAKPYLEAMFMDDQSIAQIAPSGNFGNTTSLNCNNPLLSTQQRDAICVTAAYDPTDAAVFDGEFNSNFGNLVGQTPIFGVDPDGDGPLQAPLLGFNAPTTFNGPTGPFNSAILIPLRRNVEGGGRQDDLQHTAYRIVAGMRGDLGRGLSYDASYQFGKTILAETYLNDFSVTRLGRAQQVVADPVSGAPVCISVLDGTDPNCVPYDIFAPGGVTPAALNYLQTPGFQRGDTQETVANLNITAELGEYGIQSPWADRGIGLNIGGEYRKEALTLKTDQAFSTGDLAGQGGPTIGVSGKFDVKELFGEIEVPIVSNSFIHEFTLRGGYRYSDYSVAGNSFSTDTYKIEAEIAPVRDIRLRGSYNRAVRAPNVVELFSAQSVGLTGSADPCAGAEPDATLAQCQLTGVTAAQYGSIRANVADQYNGFIGGNPDLTPETADSYTLGLVLQPRFIPGLAITVDGFDIRVKDAIGTIGFDTIVSQCVDTADPFFCDRINRDQFGSLYLTPNGFVTDINTNVGGIKTRGVDLNASYAREIGTWGNFNASLVGTYLDKLEVNPLGDITYDCAGYFGNQCGTPNPKWRHKFRLGFTFPSGIGISGQWRHFSRVKNDAASNDEDLSGTVLEGNKELKAQNYFDLALSARIRDQLNLRVGANNILDRRPPLGGGQVIPAGFGNGNTFPQVYDSLGRYLFAGFTVDF